MTNSFEQSPKSEPETIKDERRHFYQSEIYKLHEPMLNLVAKMIKELERGDYDLIIGIDASARIPALIMGKIASYIYKQKGIDVPRIRFLAGAKNEETEKSVSVDNQISEWKPQRKVLIVEEWMQTGNSIKFLTESLKKNNIQFDIASVSVSDDYPPERFEGLGASQIFYGDLGLLMSSVISRSGHLGGVVKKYGDIFSESYRKYGKNSIYNQNQINTAREGVKTVAEDLIDWYESQKQNIEE